MPVDPSVEAGSLPITPETTEPGPGASGMSSSVIPEIEVLRSLIAQQGTLLASFVQQQQTINQQLTSASVTNRLELHSLQGATVSEKDGGGTGISPTTPVQVTEPPGTTRTSPSARGDQLCNTSNLNSHNPIPEPREDQWKTIALAFAKQSNAVPSVERPIFRSMESHNPVMFLNRPTVLVLH